MEYKEICTVTKMANKLGLSRARLYQLQKAGIFPSPVYCIHTRRPFYPLSLQMQCIEIYKSGIGLNGRPVIFYSKKNKNELKSQQKTDSNIKVICRQVQDSLNCLGRKLPKEDIKNAIYKLYPEGLSGSEDIGEIIRFIYNQIDPEK